jgi:hypothetical protein
MPGQDGVQVGEAAQVVAQLSLPDLDDERRRVGPLIAKRRECGRARRRLQHPRMLARALASARVSPPVALAAGAAGGGVPARLGVVGVFSLGLQGCSDRFLRLAANSSNDG